jgi:histidinol dehydrogenase
VDHFVKKTSIVAYSQEAFARDAEAVMQLARLEGLDAHAASIRARMEADQR